MVNNVERLEVRRSLCHNHSLRIWHPSAFNRQFANATEREAWEELSVWRRCE